MDEDDGEEQRSAAQAKVQRAERRLERARSQHIAAQRSPLPASASYSDDTGSQDDEAEGGAGQESDSQDEVAGSDASSGSESESYSTSYSQSDRENVGGGKADTAFARLPVLDGSRRNVNVPRWLDEHLEFFRRNYEKYPDDLIRVAHLLRHLDPFTTATLKAKYDISDPGDVFCLNDDYDPARGVAPDNPRYQKPKWYRDKQKGGQFPRLLRLKALLLECLDNNLDVGMATTELFGWMAKGGGRTHGMKTYDSNKGAVVERPVLYQHKLDAVVKQFVDKGFPTPQIYDNTPAGTRWKTAEIKLLDTRVADVAAPGDDHLALMNVTTKDDFRALVEVGYHSVLRSNGDLRVLLTGGPVDVVPPGNPWRGSMGSHFPKVAKSDASKAKKQGRRADRRRRREAANQQQLAVTQQKLVAMERRCARKLDKMCEAAAGGAPSPEPAQQARRRRTRRRSNKKKAGVVAAVAAGQAKAAAAATQYAQVVAQIEQKKAQAAADAKAAEDARKAAEDARKSAAELAEKAEQQRQRAELATELGNMRREMSEWQVQGRGNNGNGNGNGGGGGGGNRRRNNRYGNNYNNNQQGGSTYPCTYCAKTGHLRRECPLSKHRADSPSLYWDRERGCGRHRGSGPFKEGEIFDDSTWEARLTAWTAQQAAGATTTATSAAGSNGTANVIGQSAPPSTRTPAWTTPAPPVPAIMPAPAPQRMGNPSAPLTPVGHVGAGGQGALYNNADGNTIGIATAVAAAMQIHDARRAQGGGSAAQVAEMAAMRAQLATAQADLRHFTASGGSSDETTDSESDASEQRRTRARRRRRRRRKGNEGGVYSVPFTAHDGPFGVYSGPGALGCGGHAGTEARGTTRKGALHVAGGARRRGDLRVRWCATVPPDATVVGPPWAWLRQSRGPLSTRRSVTNTEVAGWANLGPVVCSAAGSRRLLLEGRVNAGRRRRGLRPRRQRRTLAEQFQSPMEAAERWEATHDAVRAARQKWPPRQPELRKADIRRAKAVARAERTAQRLAATVRPARAHPRAHGDPAG